MVRGFNQDQKQAIYEALVNHGRDLFRKYGFQKTSIQEITKNAGIAQGTFYKFFSSKEEIYFIILEEEETKIKESFTKIDLRTEKSPKTVLKNILHDMMQTTENNPLIQEIYFGNMMEIMVKKLPAELLEAHFQEDTISFAPLIEQLKEKGFKMNKEPKIAASLLRSLFLLTLHKQEIGVNVYEETLETMIDFTVEGLITEEDK